MKFGTSLALASVASAVNIAVDHPHDNCECLSSNGARVNFPTLNIDDAFINYTFEREDGSRFEAVIGRFFLVPSAPPLQLEPSTL